MSLARSASKSPVPSICQAVGTAACATGPLRVDAQAIHFPEIDLPVVVAPKDVAVEVAVEVVQPLRNIVGQQGEGVAAQDVGDLRRISGADLCPVVQVGQRGGGYSVAAVHGAEQRKQCLVLTDRQELA